jgi:hypothetical protein
MAEAMEEHQDVETRKSLWRAALRFIARDLSERASLDGGALPEAFQGW